MSNLRIYPYYQAGRSALFWMPVFFLFFSQRCTLEQVLQLEALYYLAVVVLEVPSGYASDRLGRTLTLRISAIAGLLSAVLFWLSTGFWSLAAAQVLFAACMAFNSGTDSALLYESLQVEGRADEIVHHEAIASSWGSLAGGLAALLGGIAGSFDLSWPYALTAMVALGTVLVTFALRGPAGSERAAAPLAQAGKVLALLRQPVLAWVAAWAVSMTVVNHVPYEFFQPWLGFLFGEVNGAMRTTPLAAGAMVAGTMLLTSGAARLAPAVRQRFGTGGTLVGATVIQAVVMLGMALWIHPAMVLVVLCRGLPRGLGEPVLRAEVQPRLPDSLRATWFSVQSLVGRLAFSLSLAVTSLVVGEGLTQGVMSQVLLVAAVAAVAVAIALGAAWGAIRGRR